MVIILKENMANKDNWTTKSWWKLGETMVVIISTFLTKTGNKALVIETPFALVDEGNWKIPAGKTWFGGNFDRAENRTLEIGIKIASAIKADGVRVKPVSKPAPEAESKKEVDF